MFKTIFKHLSTDDLVQSKLLDRYIEVLQDEEPDVQRIAIKGLTWVLNRIQAD